MVVGSICRFPGMSESEESSVVIFRATNPGGLSEKFCDWKRVFFFREKDIYFFFNKSKEVSWATRCFINSCTIVERSTEVFRTSGSQLLDAFLLDQRSKRKRTQAHTHTYIYIYTYIHTYTHMYVYVCVYIYIPIKGLYKYKEIYQHTSLVYQRVNLHFQWRSFDGIFPIPHPEDRARQLRRRTARKVPGWFSQMVLDDLFFWMYPPVI